MAKIIKRTVDALQPRDKAYICFDDDVPGFGVRTMPSGIKSFILEYRPGAGGRGTSKRRLTLGRYGAMTAEQGRKAALDALAHVRLGEDPQAEKSRRRAALSVGELIDAFLKEHVRTKLKAKTRASYEPLLAKLREAHGSAKAAELSRANVSALHRGMGSTPYLANRLLAAISSLYAWAESEGRLPEGHANPARGVKKFREESRERFLTSEELGRLGDALRAAEPRFGVHACAAIRLLILTGARLNEILHAKWADIDFERGLLNLATSKTGRKSIYLNAATLALLSDLPRDESSPFIVPGEKAGQPRADLKRVWTAVTQAVGLEGLRAHDLRHSHASVGAGAGLSLPIIGRLLGHTQTATTQKYSHLSNDPVREASERIGSIIASSMDGSKSADIVPMRGGK